MHCKAHNTVREKTASVVVPFGVSHWRTAYSVQLTGEQAEREPRKIACGRTASGACFLFPIQNGRALPKPLNTQHKEVKLLEVEFFSEEEK